MENFQIYLAEGRDKEAWDRYVAAHQYGLPYHYFAWKEAVESAYGFTCPCFFAKQAGSIRGILPTAWVRPPLSKGRLVSLPYCDAGGILADTPEVEKTLFEYVCKYSYQNKIPKIEIRHAFDSLGIVETSHTQKVRMLLQLPESADTLLSSFKSKLRSQIKKPIRDGLTTKLGGAELLDCFYSVFSENMRDLGSPVHSHKWILSIFQFFGEKAKCGVVFLPDNTPAAAGIILCHTKMVSIPWASSLQKYNHLNANMLLYWSFLSFAADNGFAVFDFGRSTPGEGTYKFKAQWGAKPKPLYWREWKTEKASLSSPLKSDSPSNSNGKGRILAERVIQQLPTPFATAVGSRLRKYIPL